MDLTRHHHCGAWVHAPPQKIKQQQGVWIAFFPSSFVAGGVKQSHLQSRENATTVDFNFSWVSNLFLVLSSFVVLDLAPSGFRLLLCVILCRLQVGRGGGAVGGRWVSSSSPLLRVADRSVAPWLLQLLFGGRLKAVERAKVLPRCCCSAVAEEGNRRGSSRG